MLLLVLMVAMTALTSLGITLPRCNRQKTIYLPWGGVTFHHLVGWLKASIGDLCYRKLFMVGFLSRDDRGVCGQREVDAGIGHQIGLELCQIHIQGAIKPRGSSESEVKSLSRV